MRSALDRREKCQKERGSAERSLSRTFGKNAAHMEELEVREKFHIGFLGAGTGPLRSPAPRGLHVKCQSNLCQVICQANICMVYTLPRQANIRSYKQLFVFLLHEKRRTTLRLRFTLLYQVYFIVVVFICKCDDF